MEKDYNLLRPFDLEAAKRGEPIIWLKTECRFIGVSDHGRSARNIVEHAHGLSYARDSELRMAPLAWVEGKPVYKGDVLLHKTGVNVTAERRRNDDIDGFICTDGDYVLADNLSWIPSKGKREAWVNVYKNKPYAFKCNSKEMADNSARLGDGTIDPDRVACVRIEWEE